MTSMLLRSLTSNILRRSKRTNLTSPISRVRWHTNTIPNTPAVNITFQYPSSREDGKTVNATAHVGENILQVAKRYDIELEGACEGVCACSTCHVILENDVYDKLEEPVEDEEDMLDMAFGLTATSRLGCQVEVNSHLRIFGNAIVLY